MPLTFANASRSYDEHRRQIRFVGYDGIFEIPFLLDVDALSQEAGREERSEADHLAAFDAVRDTVQSAARRAYSHGRKNLYVLTPTDFR
ncbi:DUF1488 domain-containing protein [Afifella sp. IM 167]|uniref:DUF1488 domain-containing protein n=1 Tax=Afifella sp. IM 167 TaxID=2033586 RepID=UPI001CCC2B9F|nr:DUF1488 domain-containing protein [Afifella sp. IM 167]MBZ8133672.1 hypothetical protein [Afifella sp. IM 167]